MSSIDASLGEIKGDNGQIIGLLKEIVDELREINDKPKKYKIDKTEFVLGY